MDAQRPGFYVMFFFLGISAGLLGVSAATPGTGTSVQDAQAGEQIVGEDTRVVLIVFDGADWRPINQLRDRGRLPAFDRHIREGVYGDIRTPKAFSPVTWTKIGSGRDGEDLNVDGWRVRTDDGDQRMVQSSDVRHKRIWEYLNNAGIRTGVINYFLTWPVEPIKGVMIAGAAAQSDNLLQYPEGFIERDVVLSRDEWRIANRVFNRTDGMAGYPFVTFGFKRLDAIQHSLWKFLVPEKFDVEESPQQRRLREVIFNEYERMDRVLNRFNESWNVIIVSDSGFEAEGGRKAKSLAQFHAGQGSGDFVYPTYEGNLNPILRVLGYSVEELKWCSVEFPDPDHLNATSYLFQLCVQNTSLDTDKVVTRLNQIRYRNGRHFFEKVRYEESKQAIVGRWRLFESGVVNTSVTVSYSHQPTFHGTIPEVRKILGLQLPNGSALNIDVGPEKSGDHPGGTSGIFIASGPAFRDVPWKTSIQAVDVAPMILYMYNRPIPRQMDGRVPTGLFTAEFNNDRRLRYVNVSTLRKEKEATTVNESREQELVNRLKELGYMN